MQYLQSSRSYPNSQPRYLQPGSGRLIGRGGFSSIYSHGQDAVRKEIQTRQILSVVRELMVFETLSKVTYLRAQRRLFPLYMPEDASINFSGSDPAKWCISLHYTRLAGSLWDLKDCLYHGTYNASAGNFLMYDMQNLMWQLATLHRNNIMHRDIKPENILVDLPAGAPSYSTGQHALVLADFGSVRELDAAYADATKKAMSPGRYDLTNGVCTPRWQAPEMWENDGKYTEQADLFSMGLVFLHMLTGYTIHGDPGKPFTAKEYMFKLVSLLGPPDEEAARRFQGEYAGLLTVNVRGSLKDRILCAADKLGMSEYQRNMVYHVITKLLDWNPANRRSAYDLYRDIRYIHDPPGAVVPPLPASPIKFHMPEFANGQELCHWLGARITNKTELASPAVQEYLYLCYYKKKYHMQISSAANAVVSSRSYTRSYTTTEPPRTVLTVRHLRARMEAALNSQVTAASASLGAQKTHENGQAQPLLATPPPAATVPSTIMSSPVQKVAASPPSGGGSAGKRSAEEIPSEQRRPAKKVALTSNDAAIVSSPVQKVVASSPSGGGSAGKRSAEEIPSQQMRPAKVPATGGGAKKAATKSKRPTKTTAITATGGGETKSKRPTKTTATGGGASPTGSYPLSWYDGFY